LSSSAISPTISTPGSERRADHLLEILAICRVHLGGDLDVELVRCAISMARSTRFGEMRPTNARYRPA
jgi:hypothetical protein